MMTFDANIFVRDVDPYSHDHDDCNALLARVRATNTPVIVPVLALAEVAGALSRNLRDPVLARVHVDVLLDIPSLTLVPLDEPLAREAAEIAADRYLRGADAMYVAVARRFGCIFVTLDREARDRTATIVPVKSPIEALATLPPAP